MSASASSKVPDPYRPLCSHHYHADSNDTVAAVTCSDPIDIAMTQLIMMAMWMHTHCPSITNGITLQSVPMSLMSLSAGGTVIGQGYTASVSNHNSVVVNQTTMPTRIRTQTPATITKCSQQPQKQYPSHTSVFKRVRQWTTAGDTGSSKGSSSSPTSASEFLTELHVLTHPPLRSHPNLVTLTAFLWDICPGERPDIAPVICLEHADMGSLAGLQKEIELTYRQKRDVFRGVCCGLDALHSAGVVHGDMKAENVLIFKNANGNGNRGGSGGEYLAKICDFGFCVFTADVETDKASLYGGTPPWTAPEWRNSILRELLRFTDVYSLGLLYWRMLLDGLNPFDIPRLTADQNSDELKVNDSPPLVNYAQFSILLLEEYYSHLPEIFQILDCTIQKNPLKRSLSAVLYTLDKRNPPRPNSTVAQLKLNPWYQTADGGFDVRNVGITLRTRAVKYIHASAQAIENMRKDQFPTTSVLYRSLLLHSLGDGGLGLGDDPNAALRWITLSAQRGYIPSQAAIVRMYDYFDEPMPDVVAREANQYLANGAMNGSLTASIDYEIHWPKLKYKIWSEPDTFLINLRTRFCAGIGQELDERVMDLANPSEVMSKRKIVGTKKDVLGRLYGLDGGKNLLHGAAMLNLVETAEMLLSEYKFDINEQDNEGNTPLLLACRHGHLPMIIRLAAKGARPEISNELAETPLHWIINVPDESVDLGSMVHPSGMEIAIMTLVNEGGLLNAKAEMLCSGGDFYHSLRWAAGTPLHRAVSRRNLAAAKYLLKWGADPLEPDGTADQQTSLDLAATHHNAPMLQQLLDACSYDVNQFDEYGNTLFSRAVSGISVFELIMIHGKRYPKAVGELIDTLVSRGLDLNQVQIIKDFTFHGLRAEGRRVKVEATIGKHQKIDALFLSVFYEKLAWVEFLLSSPACMSQLDINRPNGQEGMTALFQSIRDGHKSIFRSLLAAGADPTSTFSSWGMAGTKMDTKTTCLHMVAEQGDPDLFFTKRLLGYELDIDAGNLHGITPFVLAVLEGNFHIANELLKYGADINKRMGGRWIKDSIRYTVLKKVIEKGCDNTLKRLEYLLLTFLPPKPSSAPHHGVAAHTSSISRIGPPASFWINKRTTALHYFLAFNGSRMDSAFISCFQVLLHAFETSEQMSTLAFSSYNESKEDDDDDDENDLGDIRMSPLHIAAENGNRVAVQMLLQAGADPAIQDAAGLLASDRALRLLTSSKSMSARKEIGETLRLLMASVKYNV